MTATGGAGPDPAATPDADAIDDDADADADATTVVPAAMGAVTTAGAASSGAPAALSGHDVDMIDSDMLVDDVMLLLLDRSISVVS